MKVLIIFSHPAPYKVKIFNELSKYCDLDVIFERRTAKSRNKEFYSLKEYKFNAMFLDCLNYGEEASASFKLKKYIKNNYKNYDKIIMNGYASITCLLAIKYMKNRSIPFIQMINGGVIHKENSFKKRFKTKYLSCASKYFCPNEKSSEYLTYYGAKKGDIFLYPYSNISNKDLNGEKWNITQKNIIKEKYNLPKDKPLLICAGAFIKRKNNEELIKLIKNIDAHLLLVGEGPLEKEYKKMINQNNIKNITIIPYLKEDELFSLYKTCDLFITLSKEDIFGHTVIEALAHNLPVVSTTGVLSACDAIKNGENGYLIDLKNLNNFEETVNDALKIDGDVYTSVQKYTIENNAKELYKLLS